LQDYDSLPMSTYYDYYYIGTHRLMKQTQGFMSCLDAIVTDV